MGEKVQAYNNPWLLNPRRAARTSSSNFPLSLFASHTAVHMGALYIYIYTYILQAFKKKKKTKKENHTDGRTSSAIAAGMNSETQFSPGQQVAQQSQAHKM